MKIKNENYKEPDFEDVIEKSDDSEFETGQGYEDTPAKKLICKKCKGDKWIVGKGDYWTGVKCPNCLYELCVHEG